MTHVQTRTYTRTHTRTHTITDIHTYARTHARTQAHARTHTDTRAHARTQAHAFVVHYRPDEKLPHELFVSKTDKTLQDCQGNLTAAEMPITHVA